MRLVPLICSFEEFRVRLLFQAFFLLKSFFVFNDSMNRGGTHRLESYLINVLLQRRYKKSYFRKSFPNDVTQVLYILIISFVRLCF